MPNPKLHEVFEDKSWSGDKGAPRSGHGSSLRRTRRLRKALPGFLRRYGVKTFIDAPCGDWTFMQAVDLSMLTSYIGCDISHALLDANQAEFGTDTTTFRFLDITCDPLPKGDMLMCRECLIHLRDVNRWAFFENFAASQIDWLLLTIDYVSGNIPLTADGGHQNFNPMQAPFNLPDPIEIIPESDDAVDPNQLGDPNVGPWKRKRAMGLWSHNQIVTTVQQKNTLSAT
ncbi:MAG: hypothetical protein OEY05_12340 [Paracoccaceae bacterium]|nr:hypothetical protein [Paracoccaceae bacterium]